MSSHGLFEFGDFRLEVAERQLLRHEKPLSLTPKAFDVLSVLVQNAGSMVTREDLKKQIWPETFVENATLAVNISTIRKALREAEDGVTYIETVPKYGYKFTAIVKAVAVAPVTPAVSVFRNRDAGRKVWAGAAILALAAAGAVVLFSHRGRADSHPSLHTLAILPFKALNISKPDPYLEIGFSDALISRMTADREFSVRPIEAVRAYADSGSDTLSAGHRLGVEAILEGSIERDDARLRVRTRLLRVEDGRTLWESEFDEQFANVFQLEDSISERLATVLQPAFSARAIQRLARPGSEIPAAYEALLKGRYFWSRRSEESLSKAIRFFEEAVRLDPKYADAYSGLADCYALMSFYGDVEPQQYWEKARTAALRAVALNDSSAEAHTSLAYVRFYHDWDWTGAEADFQRAVALNPGYATAHLWYAEFLRLMGRYEESLAESKRALEADPVSLVANAEMAMTPYYQGRDDEAIRQLKTTLNLDVAFALTHFTLGWVYEQTDRYADALAEYRQINGASSSPWLLPMIGHASALSGDRNQAKLIAATLETKSTYVSPYYLAQLYSALGERSKMFAALRRGYADHCWTMATLKVEPKWNAWRSDPEFQSIVSGMKFP